jgi:tetratricopeptide (TPR) repeat protein
LTKRALRILESSEGTDTPDAAFALTAEARILTHLGRPAEAIPVVLRALHISRRPKRPDRVGTVFEWSQLGKAYAALGEFPNAANALLRAIDAYQRLYGDSGQPFARMLDSYAADLEKTGRLSAARAALARAATIRGENRVTHAPTLNLRAN